MKTAISVPDDLFEAAEELARRTQKSRSQLFSDALREYVARHAVEKVTAALDQLVEEAEPQPDPAVFAAARRALERSEW